MADKVCFVVCAVDEESTEVSQQADELFELVLEPALERYRFNVVRVNQLPQASVISPEAVELVQNAELCVVDLTGHDPNVFYHCGRRHETGKPFIQLLCKMRKEQPLPFDVAGIRTIEYDCSTPYSTLASIRTLQEFIDEFERLGYATTSSGVSLSTIAAAAGRIERHLSQLSDSKFPASRPHRLSGTEGTIDSFRPPREIFLEAVSADDVDRAASVLPRLRDTQDFVSAAGMVASAGLQIGCDELIAYIDRRGDQMECAVFRFALSSIVEFYGATDREREGLPIVDRLATEFVGRNQLRAEDEAAILNQLQRIKYAAGDYPGALQEAMKVLELQPQDESYLYNASVIYNKLGDLPRAEAFVDRYFLAGGADSDNLMHAVEVYVAVGRIDDAQRVFQQLVEVDAGKAEFLLMNDKIRDSLSFPA